MKLAVISDIHGNQSAFEAFLDTVGDFSMCLCLGDLVDYGMNPRSVIREVREHANFVVRGNHDQAVASNVDCGCSYVMKDVSVKSREYMSKILEKDDLEYLKLLPTEKMINIDGRRSLLVHAGRTDLYRYFKPNVRDAELEYEFDESRCDLVLSGHTHFPLVRQLKNFLFVNPGSLGQPRDGDPRASYAIIEGDNVEIRRVEYDIEKEVDNIMRTTLDEKTKEKLSFILRTGNTPE